MRPHVFAFAAGAPLVFGSCGGTEPSSPRTCREVELIVAASDYSSSVVCGAPGCVEDRQSTGLNLGVDPMLVSANGRAFYLARDNDLLFEVDPTCGVPSSFVSLHGLAPKHPVTGVTRPANPHDAAAGPDGTIVVPLFGAGRVAFVKDGAVEETSIDLAPYDSDGNPQPDAVRIVSVDGAAKAFVTLERLDDRDFLRSNQPSQMLRIDVATRIPEAVIDLVGRNPFNPMSELHGALFLAEPGNFESADDELAGIERFETASSTTRLLVHERDLGGSVTEVSVTDGCGVAIIAGPETHVNPTALVTFDPETGRVLTTMRSPVLGPTPGYDLQGLAWRGRTLYVGDRRRGSGGYGVHVLDRTGGCDLVDTGRKIILPRSPVALRAAP